MGFTELAANLGNFLIPQFEDLCDLIDASYIADGDVAVKLDPSSPRVSNIPCFYEPLLRTRNQVFQVDQLWTERVRLLLPASAETYGIAVNYIIEVHARADLDRPVLTFEHPTVRTESFWPIVEVLATSKNPVFS
jgi:hypothetical protein